MAEEIKKLQIFIDKTLDGKTSIKVLEAGCGSSMYLSFNKNEVYMVDSSARSRSLITETRAENQPGA